MNIIEAIAKLRDDIKTWVTNNLKAIKDSQFSGDYNDLTNAPNISEDETENLIITDPYGNIIFRANADGFETTALRAENVILMGEESETNVGEKLVEVANDLIVHENNGDIHVTLADKKNWDQKSEFSGDYNDLENAPNIIEDEEGDLVIVDPNGNIIFRANETGFETIKLVTKELVVDGKDILELIGSGGGGTASNLPSYTTEDIGKFLYIDIDDSNNPILTWKALPIAENTQF